LFLKETLPNAYCNNNLENIKEVAAMFHVLTGFVMRITRASKERTAHAPVVVLRDAGMKSRQWDRR